MKRLLCVLLALCLLPIVLGATLTGSGSRELVSAAESKTHSGVTTIADPTIAQIQEEFAKYQKPTARFTTWPSVTKPYATGKLDPNFIQMATNRINYYRFIAKIPPVTNSEAKNDLAQHAAVLLGATNLTSHQPPQPKDMSDEFYRDGLIGAKNSNISSYSYKSVVQNSGWTWDRVEKHKTEELLAYGLMFQIRDYDSNVYMNLGHRRYLLSPYLRDYGIGYADSVDRYNSYIVVTHAGRYGPFIEIDQNPSYDFIAWPPSGNCPNDMMLKIFPWHVTLNDDKYLVPPLLDANGNETGEGDRTGIKITVTRQTDGRVWVFDKSTPKTATGFSGTTAYKSKYFIIDKHGYGFGPIREEPVTDAVTRRFFISNALIFRPDFEDNTPLMGRYTVKITGLKYLNGTAAEIQYDVNFFDIKTCVHNWGEWTTTIEATCVKDGEQVRVCSKCNAKESRTIPALGHLWGDWEQTKAPTCLESGLKQQSCSRCGAKEQETIPALGHNWTEWNETAAPTCTESGSQTRSCQRCKQVQNEELPALGHDWEEISVIEAPTCTNSGLRNVVCRRCSLEEQQTVAALGHDWDAGTIKFGPEHGEIGSCTYVCQRCGEIWTEDIVNPFADVSEGKFYFKPILWACYRNPRVTGGTDATHFSPNATCTREQVMTFLYAAYGKPEYHLTENPFKDVKKKYYYDAIMWAVENGITSGMSADTFGVGVSCKREQVVTFLWTAAGMPTPTKTDNPFKDVSSNKYYYNAVLWAVENGITGGMSADTFGVGKTCTRAQIVTFLYAAFGKES